MPLKHIFLVLAHWNNSPRIDMSLHSDTLSWFQAYQCFLVLNDVCLAEKHQIPIFIVFGLTQSGLELMIYNTRGEHANHYTIGSLHF